MRYICGKDFRQQWDLQRHKKIHTGFKSHICEICDKAFYEKSTLKMHQRINTGDKPQFVFNTKEKVTSKLKNRNHMLCMHVKKENDVMN